MKQSLLKRLYRMLAFILCCVGLVIQAKGMEHPYVMLYFFTILTNIICAGYFLYMAITKKEHGLIMGGLTTSILLVMLVFHFILLPTSTFYQGEIGWNNLILHYIIPFMSLIDFVVFQHSYKIRWYHPLIWSSIPLSYVIFIFIRAEVGKPFYTGYGMSRYPYYFLDIDAIGLSKVTLSITGLLLFYILLGYVLWLVKYLVKKILKL